MVFSSPIFLYFFLPIVLAGYFACGRGGRNLFLVAASLLFYAWGEGGYVLLMLASVQFNYVIGLRIQNVERGGTYLALGMTGNLLALGFFKYWGAVWDFLQGLWGGVGESDALPLPLGISFFTFQAISYLVDVYRGRAKAQGNLVDLALYITLFPQLVAGPIVRYESVAEAIRNRRTSWEGAAAGVELFIVGLAKKMLLANTLGTLADACFAAEPEELPLGAAWLGLAAYALQIYFDFSGYTDMARGLGRVFGFEFPINFRFPYLSRSVREFWRRWHISLSTWFRDYVYIPLGGSRAGKWRTWRNLWIVFLLCGVWHGASWTFVIWGAAHGLWMSLEHSRIGRVMDRMPGIARWGVTGLFLLLSWVLFRSESMTQAGEYFAALFSWGTIGMAAPVAVIQEVDTRFWIVFCVAVGLSLNVHGAFWSRVGEKVARAYRVGLVFRFLGFGALMALSVIRLAGEDYNPFIYFRF